MLGSITMIFHFFQAVIVLFLIITNEKLAGKGAIFNLYTTTKNMRDGYVHFFIMDWSIPLSIFFFFMLSGAFQLYQVYYLAHSPLCKIYYRYIEYSLSAALMIICIGIEVGIRDIQVLFLLAGYVSTLCWLGYIADIIQELSSDQSLKWYPHSLAWFCNFSVFSIILTAYGTSIYVNGKPPWFVHMILFTMLCLFSVFGLVQWYDFRHRNLRWRNFDEHCEYVGKLYDLLSLTAKSSLAWLILMPLFFTNL